MQTRPMGRTGVQVPIIGQGTWRMEQDDPERCREALIAGIDAGMTHIDTAELYGSGKVEELIRDVVQPRRNRLYLVSKVLPSNATREGTIRACEASLRRLGTDYLDCYLLHWRGDIPLEETFAGFEQLKKDGKIRAYGVSNFDVADLEDAVIISGAHNLACNQVLYHVGERSIEHRVIPYCERHGITVVAYSPLGAGNFPAPSSRGGQVLQEIAEAHDATAYQVALCFVLRIKGLLTIPKAAEPEHARDNARAAQLSLSDAELTRIEQAFPLRAEPSELPML